MPELEALHIANNIADLERLAIPEKLLLGRNPQILENALKNLYKEIFREIADQEKCFILCLRYLLAIEKLYKIGDAKFVKIKYTHEICRVNNKIEELRPILEGRYEEQSYKERQKQKPSLKKKSEGPKASIKTEQPLFSSEFVSVRELFEAIQNNTNILIIDIRPENEYLESNIQFDKIINIPENIIVPGLSAHVIGTKLPHTTQQLWDKRDSFAAMVFLDWNSGSDNVTSNKLTHIKAAVVEWDCLRQYKQYPVILNGGFKEFLDTYPGSVTNVHVNFIRNNEDIDELLELDGISYPEPDQNVSIMPLKQFTIEDLEESVKVEEQLYEDDDDDDDEENKENIVIDSGLENTYEEKEPDLPKGDPPSPKSGEPLIPKIEKPAIGPKGGGAALDKPSLFKANDESADEIKSKIEEQRIKLLMEARNKKQKPFSYIENTGNFIEGPVGDRPSNQIKKIPPVIRRDTKPKKQEYVFNGWCGLVNVKNTCYMNTVLQCLKCIPVIASLVHSNYEKYITRGPPLIINEFANVIKTLCQGTEYDKKVHRPTIFYDVVCRLDPVYKKGRHEDCMEFFLFLFNHLSDDCSTDIKKNTVMIERGKAWYNHLQGRTSFWVDLFYYQFKCTKICQVCNLKADSYETDNTLMLPVPYRPSLKIVHLKELIDEYLEDNQILDYKCSRCQHMRVINKKSVVIEPEILVIVLKRYYQDEYQETRKNNIYVDFDLNFKFGNCNYSLCSVAQHKGTMDYGHYFAHGALNDNVWVEFNDERTIKFTGDWESIKASACAFFYCKVNKKTSKL